MSNTVSDILTPVSGCPCDSCPSSNLCTEECATFDNYVIAQSPKKRADVLVDFKASVEKMPGARELAGRSPEDFYGYKRQKKSKSQQGWDNKLIYPSSSDNI